ncbi:MAG: LPXTG cell wall anchor domain-containing protein [Microbacteriaceae bacterium]
MNNNARKLGALACLVGIFGMSAALPASATVVSEWGVFSESTNGYDAAVSFTDPDFPDAEIMVSDEQQYDWYAPADEFNEGFSAADPLGQLIGANNESDAYLFLKPETAANNSQPVTIEIEFANPVPAGQLVLALSDIDSDHSHITMTDAFGNSVPAASIIGTATNNTFNWYDIADTTSVPVVEAFDETTVVMGDAPDGTDGSTGFVRPSVAIETISISTWTEDGFSSSERIWIGQTKGSDASDSLASTGVSDSLYLVATAGGALIAAGAIVALRRRQA